MGGVALPQGSPIVVAQAGRESCVSSPNVPRARLRLRQFVGLQQRRSDPGRYARVVHERPLQRLQR